jgi:DNA-directed RNA polymerase specialized sigma24 family protein
MKGNEIYSDKITKGRRTYFFDINKSEKGDLYLKVSESKKTENGFEHHRLIVFEEDIKDFSEAFEKALTKFKEIKEPKQTDDKAYSVEKIREAHQQAYLPWTPEDDSKLELLFCEGKKVKELAQIFGRNDGAISSRIKKLELKEKYGR